jgi:TonB-dependent receptor
MKVKGTYRKFWLFMAAGLIFLFGTGMVMAQTIITGRVVDAETGSFLPGANVQLVRTNYGAASDRAGVYKIPNVPPGEYTLRVTYMGYERFEVSITVQPGIKVLTRDIDLTMSVLEMEGVVVEGLRQGQIKALAQQQQAPNIKNVVSQELIERFPDENPAEVLQRVSGVFIDRSLGDGRYVLIRGTEPRLSQILVNGERVATNRRREREPQLDIVGSAQIASMEVVKAITPDMNGDAIGGAVNMVTRSAFDYSGSRIDLVLGGGYAQIDGKAVGTGKVHFSNRYGENKNVGLTFTANWDIKTRGTDRIEPEWDDAEDINGNEIPYALDQMDLRDYRNTFSRKGIGAGIEYRVNDKHQWFLRGLVARMDDDQIRGRMRLRVSKGDYLNPDGTLTSKSRIVREHDHRVEELIQQNFAFGGLHKFGGIELDYTAAYTWATEEHLPQWESSWELDEKVNLALDFSDQDFPKWETTNLDPDYQYDPNNYEFDALDWRKQYSANRIFSTSFNLKVPVTLGGIVTELKFGGKMNLDKKEQEDTRMKYKWEGDDFTLARFVEDFDDTDFLKGNYRFGPIADQEKIKDFYLRNRNLWEGEINYQSSLGEDYTGYEDVYAGYGMATMYFGNMMVLGGVRYELTNAEYEGKELYYDTDGDFQNSKDTTVTRDYSNILPMVHLRYRLTPMTNIRLAWTNGFSRPPYQAYAPYKWINPDDEEIVAGNPDLEPTTSMNLDFMVEHYFQGIGIAAGGFFYKNLKDIIYESQFEIEGGVYDGWDQEQFINGGDATLYGFEVNWHQELSFLPGWMSGFGIFANYTHTWAETDLLGREGFLPGQAGDVGNFSIQYEKYGLSIRLSANYTAKYLNDVGKDEDRDEWDDSHLQFDLSATYDLGGPFMAFFEAINITNEPQVQYMGDRSRPIDISYYSWWVKAGVKMRFGS